MRVALDEAGGAASLRVALSLPHYTGSAAQEPDAGRVRPPDAEGLSGVRCSFDARWVRRCYVRRCRRRNSDAILLRRDAEVSPGAAAAIRVAATTLRPAPPSAETVQQPRLRFTACCRACSFMDQQNTPTKGFTRRYEADNILLYQYHMFMQTPLATGVQRRAIEICRQPRRCSCHAPQPPTT